jgi:two-component system, LuxR family, response regulator FixJ
MASDKPRIYIVDDDESVSRSLMILLVEYELEVNVYASAEEFLTSVPNDAAGCLILDIHLPGMDGWKVLQEFFRRECKRPVIVISADGQSGLKERALQAGAVGFLLKPFLLQDLDHLISLAFGPNNMLAA